MVMFRYARYFLSLLSLLRSYHCLLRFSIWQTVMPNYLRAFAASSVPIFTLCIDMQWLCHWHTRPLSNQQLGSSTSEYPKYIEVYILNVDEATALPLGASCHVKVDFSCPIFPLNFLPPRYDAMSWTMFFFMTQKPNPSSRLGKLFLLFDFYLIRLWRTPLNKALNVQWRVDFWIQTVRLVELKVLRCTGGFFLQWFFLRFMLLAGNRLMGR